jgi:glycosyltransferase involved in cell wall biosynthesis
MNLVVVSHKECWADKSSPSGYSTIGGFPQQMQAISEIFDTTTIILALFDLPKPAGAMPIAGKNLRVRALPAPKGKDLIRKIALLSWLPRHLPFMVSELRKADAVHAPVPGDLGTLGILIALLLKKKLFVRHCGTWGNRTTMADRFLAWLLPRISSQRNVVMATGGGEKPPCEEAPEISWIFSTTLSANEWQALPRKRQWVPGDTLRLVTVSRLDPAKNTEAAIRALPLIRRPYADCTLGVVGDGPMLERLRQLAIELGISNAVTFHGRLDHGRVLGVLLESDLFVFPTCVKEGFPKVVAEAFACGLPVVATGVSVVPHLIRRGAGAVLARTDPAAVAEAVAGIIRDGRPFSELSDRARSASQDYTIQNWQNIIRDRLSRKWGQLQVGG